MKQGNPFIQFRQDWNGIGLGFIFAVVIWLLAPALPTTLVIFILSPLHNIFRSIMEAKGASLAISLCYFGGIGFLLGRCLMVKDSYRWMLLTGLTVVLIFIHYWGYSHFSIF